MVHFWNFSLIFSYHSGPWVAETAESETAEQGGVLYSSHYYYYTGKNTKHKICPLRNFKEKIQYGQLQA